MQVTPFKLERYFAKYEFTARYLLSSSDCEPLTKKELLSWASPDHRALWDDLWLGYTESKGHPLLLESVAGLYRDLDQANIIEVVPEEGIFMAMHTMLKATDHVVVSCPAYQSLFQVARDRIGCSVSYWMPDPSNWQFDVNHLANRIQDNTRLIVINFPHNPTGATLTEEQFRQIMALAEQSGCFVFSDEMYRWSEYDAANRLPSACETYRNAISLCGLSKSFALPGLRVGWLATQNDELMRQFTVFKDYTTICGSAPSEILAIIALASRERIIARTLQILGDNLSILDQFFSQYAGVLRWQRPKAGTITLVELLHERPIDQFAADLVNTKGVMIVPSSQFDMSGNYFRLGFGRRNMAEALAYFEEFLQQSLI